MARSRTVAGLEQNRSRPRSASARTGLAAAVLAASLVAAGLAALAQGQSAATAQDAIFARKTLMNAMCDRMMEIERMIAFGKVDPGVARADADAIAAMLLAFPHLFPPGSNQWKPDADRDPVADTFASPDLWTAFADFSRQAVAAAKNAHDLSRAARLDDVKTLARELRIGCDTCHALYLEDP
jgi:cytochrome c556